MISVTIDFEVLGCKYHLQVSSGHAWIAAKLMFHTKVINTVVFNQVNELVICVCIAMLRLYTYLWQESNISIMKKHPL